MSKASQIGKRGERQVAKMLNANVTSKPGLSSADVTCKNPTKSDGPFIIEVKHWDKFPKWLIDAYNTAKGHAQKAQGLPLVVLKPKYDRDAMVLTSLKKFEEWFGKI